MARLNDKGHELLDDTPMAIPLRGYRPESLQDQIRRMVRHQLSEHAAARGAETFEEADDFDVDDDFDPHSPWELNFDQDVAPLPSKAQPKSPEAPASPTGGAAPGGPGPTSSEPPAPQA